MRSQVFAIALFIAALVFSNSDFAAAQPPEKQLLIELRNSLTYDSSLSTKLIRWNASTDHCRWRGVKCDVEKRVSGLDLSRESISGGINDSSSSLFDLGHLRRLNLAQNSFDSVELPLGFGKLANLRYLNLSNSGFTGRVPPDFSGLTRLVVLDLSSAFQSLDIPDLEILIRNFTRLTELYLDGANISAQGRVWCNAISSHLPNLKVLSLSNCYLTGPLDSSLVKLRSLSTLRLDGNTLSSPFPEFLSDFPDLSVATLSSCDLFGTVPERLFRLESLRTIDLSGNRGLEGSLPDFAANQSLQDLLLSYTNFSGGLSESIGNLRMLTNLDLRSCQFSGLFPGSIRNLTHLVYLDLSLNQFSGSVPSFAYLKNLTVINLYRNNLTGRILDFVWEGLENLNFIDVGENSLEGEIPASLFVLPSLKVLHLSNNSFYGRIRDSGDSSSSPLEVLELNVNSLEGPIPRFFFELRNLSSLDLSSNKFNGSVELTDFRKLKNLVNLDLSHNRLSINVDKNIPISSLFPRLGSLMLASCNLRKFPPLMNQSSLMMLDLSNNHLNGEIPNWVWEVGNGFLRFLNLSHNQFVRLQKPYDFRSLQFLDLHSNLLSGQVPVSPSLAVFIDFSSNNFSSSLPSEVSIFLQRAFSFSVADNKISGEIPPSLCNGSLLQILDLSNNSLHGQIPSCLLHNTELSVLNLRRNNLNGDIPDALPLGCNVETLDLSFNTLRGKVPKSLGNCKEIEVLNLGNNALNDDFPCWLKSLSKLRVLVLRFNNFHGNISCLDEDSNIITWPNVQIIDVASNNFNGTLPANLLTVERISKEPELDRLHFSSLTANGIYYQDSVTVTLKGLDIEMEKILTIFTSVDFSNNHFRGSIPDTIGRLHSLYVLNFSHNALSGHIPESVGSLEKLESLDFSVNGLTGEIPSQLASLTFLSFLNLSYNHLVGRIPEGGQMQTFTESSYRGNEGLCGFPLNQTCIGVVREEGNWEGKYEERQMGSDSGLYFSAGLGFVVGLGIIFGPLVFCARWRNFYNGTLNKLVMLVLRPKSGNEGL